MMGIGIEIYNSDHFKSNFKSFVQSLAKSQINSIQTTLELPFFSIPYLLECANIFVISDDSALQEPALRIAQGVILSREASTEDRQIAALILSRLLNWPALELATQKEFIEKDYLKNLGFYSRVKDAGNRIASSIRLTNGEKISLNRFQLTSWETIKNYDIVSISAPTSSGKSFLLINWIYEYILNGKKNIIYIAPTRSLIQQVEEDLRDRFRMLQDDISISSMPLVDIFDDKKSNIFIFTQERLHHYITQIFGYDIKFDAIVVDEAHKLGDNHRGILLQHAIDRVIELNSNAKVIFASPNIENPKYLIEDIPENRRKQDVNRDEVTVNQNLFWLQETRGSTKGWTVSLLIDRFPHPLGHVSTDLPAKKPIDRLSTLSFQIGKNTHGNLIYANIPSDAETIAIHLSRMLDKSESKELEELAAIAQKQVHKDYVLTRVVPHGVAFHYGNMPIALRTRIEELFKSGHIRFLICTSTLVEGVNLPCRNIFLQGPKKGRKFIMEPADFWNLAGRAGRWGKEFHGNIFCVDPQNKKLWHGGEAPRYKVKATAKNHSEDTLRNSQDFIAYIKKQLDDFDKKFNNDYDYLLSYLASAHIKGIDIANMPCMKSVRTEQRSDLRNLIEKCCETTQKINSIIPLNPGVNPLGIHRLYRRFGEKTSNCSPEEFEVLLLPDPNSFTAANELTEIFGRLNKAFGPQLGYGGKVFYNALLTVNWLRSFSIPRIIDAKLKSKTEKGIQFVQATEIRNSLDDIETVARFLAPKYLSCYAHTLKKFFIDNGQAGYAERVTDYSIFLEFGVSQKTHLSFIALGLSRTATLDLTKFILEPELSKEEASLIISEGEWKYWGIAKETSNELEKLLSLFNSSS